jgi:hypothetical protein
MVTKVPPKFLTQQKKPGDQLQIPAGTHPYGPFAPAGVFSEDVHDNLIRTKGFKSVHWRHALNPNRKALEGGVDLTDRSDVGAMNMYDPREFYVAIQQIGWQDQYIIQGIHGSSSIMSVNYTTYYEGGQKDRVFLRKHDIVVINSGHAVLVGQLFEFKPAGPQRLKFPILEVDYLSDGQKVRYEQNIDFVIKDGMLEWIGDRRPSWDAQSGRGAVLSINYWTKPYFSVLETPRVMREVFANPPGNPGQQSFGTYISGSAVLKAVWLDDAFQAELPEWPRALEPDRTKLTRS